MSLDLIARYPYLPDEEKAHHGERCGQIQGARTDAGLRHRSDPERLKHPARDDVKPPVTTQQTTHSQSATPPRAAVRVALPVVALVKLNKGHK
jgi:hypothetical protein